MADTGPYEGLVLADAWARMSHVNAHQRRQGDGGNDDDSSSPRAVVTIGAVRDINSDDDGGDRDRAASNLGGTIGSQIRDAERRTIRVPRHHPAGHAQPPPAIVSEARRAQRRESRLRRQQERDVFGRIKHSRSRAMSIGGGGVEWTFVDEDGGADYDSPGSDRDDGGDFYAAPTPYYFAHNPPTFDRGNDPYAARFASNAAPDHIGAALSKLQRHEPPPRAAAAATAVSVALEPQSNAVLVEPSMPPDNSIIDASSGFSPSPLEPLSAQHRHHRYDTTNLVASPRFMFGPSNTGAGAVAAAPPQASAGSGVQVHMHSQRDVPVSVEQQRRDEEQAAAAAEKQRQALLQQLLSEQRQRREQEQQSRWQREDERFGGGGGSSSAYEQAPPLSSSPPPPSIGGVKYESPLKSSIDKRYEQQQKHKLTSYQVRFLQSVSNSREQALKVLALLPASQRKIVMCAIVEDLCATHDSSAAAAESYVRRGHMMTPISVISANA